MEFFRIINNYSSNQDVINKGIVNFKSFITTELGLSSEQIQKFCDESLQISKLYVLFAQMDLKNIEQEKLRIWLIFKDHYKIEDEENTKKEKFIRFLSLFEKLLLKAS